MPKYVSMHYDPKIMTKAINDVRKGGKIRAIAQKYGIKKSTLHFRLKNPGHKTSFGPSPYLNTQEEICLENWLVDLSKRGFPQKKVDLQKSVKKILDDHPRKNPFKHNYPGEGWVRAFSKRHPNISLQTCEGVAYSSAHASETDIRKWFTEVEKYFLENDLMDALNDPRRVTTGIETRFKLCSKSGKVLIEEGFKNVYSYNAETSSSKENITVMFTFSAAGKSCPPLVVFNYKRIPHKIAASVPSQWGVARSDNGWMSPVLFYEYIENIFYPHLLRERIPFPVIYFIDGHKTHLTYEISKLCTKLNIVLIAHFPNATRIQRREGAAIFKPVKTVWSASSREWLIKNPGQAITKNNFAEVLEIAIRKSIKQEKLIKGFKACGLVPFNPDAIDDTNCASQIETEDFIPDPLLTNTDNVLTFEQFLTLVGEEKITELQNIPDINNVVDDNLRILHNLYYSFGSHSLKNENMEMNLIEPKEQDSDSEYAPYLELQRDSSNDQISPKKPNSYESYTLTDFSHLSQKRIKQASESEAREIPAEPNPAFKIYNSETGEFLIVAKTQGKEKERKKIREQTKIGNKEVLNNKKNGTGKRGTNLCKICSTTIKISIRLVCDLCSSLFHIKCIPKSHKIHIPDDLVLDPFICHICHNL